MGKRLFSGDSTPLPDNLRCRRSDGRQWRCPQPAKPGLSFCEHHYQQVRRNQDNIKNTNAAAPASAESERRPLLMADPPPLSKKRRRRQMRKCPSASERVMSEKMEELNVERELSDLKSNSDLFMPVMFRHKQPNGREWQCSKTPKAFLNICDRRYLRCKQPNEENNKAIEPKPKRIPRFAVDLMPSIKRRRQRRLKGETRAEGPMMMMSEQEEVAEPPATRGLPIQEAIRCRRSDGRKWRCSQPAIPGLSFCEHHQMRCQLSYGKNTRVKVAKRRRRRKGEQPAEDLTRVEQNEDGLKPDEVATPELNLCCKEDNRKNDVAEQREEEEEASEPSTPEATLGQNVHGNDQQCCNEDKNRNKEITTKPNCRLQLAGDLQPSMKDHSLPDHLRCRRSDGRKWRCPQLSMPSVGFCEYHYLQVRRNQRKRKNTKLASGTKRKRGWRLAANQSLARKLRRKRLKGEVTMRIVQEERDDVMEATNVEVTRDLPNGVMAILPAPVRGPTNASPWLHWKIGSDDGCLFGRRFRSKNAELVPLGKKLPFVRSVVDRRKKVCHRCRGRENKVECMIRCLNCQEFFCTTCVET